MPLMLVGAADSRAGARVGLWPLWHRSYQLLTGPDQGNRYAREQCDNSDQIPLTDATTPREVTRLTTWMWHPRRSSDMAGTSTPYPPGGPSERVRLTSHGTAPEARQHQRP